MNNNGMENKILDSFVITITIIMVIIGIALIIFTYNTSEKDASSQKKNKAFQA